MHFTAAKSLTITLILCLGIMQLLLPFIHTHYDGQVSHGGDDAQLLHIHGVEIAQQFVDYDDARLMIDDTQSNIVSVDQAIPSKKQLEKLLFTIIVCIATIFSCAVLAYVYYVPASDKLKRGFLYTQAPPRAPPHSS